MLGIAVVVTQVEHEAGESVVRIAFDKDDAVVGILILAPDAPESMIAF